MIIAGIDAATTSGIGILQGTKLLCAQSFKSEGANDAEIFSSFRSWLTVMLKEYNVEYAAIEAPLPTNRGVFQFKVGNSDAFGQSVQKVMRPMSSMATFLRLYGLRAHAIQICDELKIEYGEVNVRDWRGAIYGQRSAPKGQKNASVWWKQQAVERCKLLGWEVHQTDACEAALIADFARVKNNPTIASFADELFAAKPERKRRWKR